MSEEGADETCDQTGPNCGQVSFIQSIETKPFSNSQSEVLHITTATRNIITRHHATKITVSISSISVAI